MFVPIVQWHFDPMYPIFFVWKFMYPIFHSCFLLFWANWLFRCKQKHFDSINDETGRSVLKDYHTPRLNIFYDKPNFESLGRLNFNGIHGSLLSKVVGVVLRYQGWLEVDYVQMNQNEDVFFWFQGLFCKIKFINHRWPTCLPVHKRHSNSLANALVRMVGSWCSILLLINLSRNGV